MAEAFTALHLTESSTCQHTPHCVAMWQAQRLICQRESSSVCKLYLASLVLQVDVQCCRTHSWVWISLVLHRLPIVLQDGHPERWVTQNCTACPGINSHYFLLTPALCMPSLRPHVFVFLRLAIIIDNVLVQASTLALHVHTQRSCLLSPRLTRTFTKLFILCH